MFAFDGFEERLEIPLTEAARAVPFDDLEKQRRPIRDGLGENLQEIAFVIAVCVASQWVEVTTPNVPSISGRVVKGLGLILLMEFRIRGLCCIAWRQYIISSPPGRRYCAGA